MEDIMFLEPDTHCTVCIKPQTLVVRRMYSKTEVARMYFPSSAHTNANVRHKLVMWLQRCRPLWLALQRLGYTPGCHDITPQMLDFIFYYLGEPEGVGKKLV